MTLNQKDSEVVAVIQSSQNGATKALQPKSVRIEATLKYFGLDKGSSEGTAVSIEYLIPEGISRNELTKLMLTENERLDVFCLLSERLRGSLSDVDYKNRRDTLKLKYESLLGKVTEAGHNGD